MSGYINKLRLDKDLKMKKYYYELKGNFLLYFTEKG